MSEEELDVKARAKRTMERIDEVLIDLRNELVAALAAKKAKPLYGRVALEVFVVNDEITAWDSLVKKNNQFPKKSA